jgi:hypothetical protein
VFSTELEISLYYVLLYCERHIVFCQTNIYCSGEHTAFMLGKIFCPESGFGKAGSRLSVYQVAQSRKNGGLRISDRVLVSETQRNRS